MTSDQWVDIVHPDLPGQVAHVHRASVPQHAKAGWREAHSPVDPAPVVPNATPDEPDEDPDLEEGD